MKYLLIHTLMMLLLQKYVMCEGQCGERSITGAVGGAATLPVGRTEGGTEVRSFIWGIVGKDGSIATTSSGGSTSILQDPYDGRLSSTSDGSLIITKLSQEDQGTYLAQIPKQKCFYHLTVFNNLTEKDVTINSDVTGNKTCEVFTCSANSSNVTISWRSLNSSDVNQTENVVIVPPRNINFTYICTAKNPVSNASKAVRPREYCNNSSTLEDKDKNRYYRGFYIGVAFLVIFILFMLICIIIAAMRGNKGNKLGCYLLNKKKEALTQEANTYEMNDEDHTGQEQKPEEGRKKNNVKSKQESAMCSPATIYSQIQHPQAMEPQESQSNNINNNTVYSTVQHAKQKNNQTIQPSPSKGNPSKAPTKPPHKVLEPPKDNNQKISPIPANGKPSKAPQKPPHTALEPSKGKSDQKTLSQGANGDLPNSPLGSCYAQVQPHIDKNNQKSPLEGPNGDHSKAPLESLYEQVKPPKDKNNQKSPLEGPNGDRSKAPLESLYEEVKLPKSMEAANDCETQYCQIQGNQK